MNKLILILAFGCTLAFSDLNAQGIEFNHDRKFQGLTILPPGKPYPPVFLVL